MTRARWDLGLLLVIACTPHERPQEPQAACATGMVLIEGGPVGAGLCVDATEVTTAAFATCVAAKQCGAPLLAGEACNITRADRAEHPVNCVTVEQAQAFCGWLGKRLPGETEWSWIAGGVTKEPSYPWGKEPPDATRACMQRGGEGTCEVGGRTAGASREGVLDLIGNVEEWTLDGASARLRGGSWADSFAGPAVREGGSQQSGLRCVSPPRSPVQAIETDGFRPLSATPGELPVLAARVETEAPTRPLANLAVLHRVTDGPTQWPLGDGFVAVPPATAPGLGLRDGFEVGGLPEALRDLAPWRDLGATVLMRAGSARLRLVALEREGLKIRWQAALGTIGSSYEQAIAPRTAIVEFFGDRDDMLVGFALDSGREVWRLRGGADGVFSRVQRMWIEGERAVALGDRGFFAFDATSGALLWSGVKPGESCGAAVGEGLVVVEDVAGGHRVLDAASGAEQRRIATTAKACRWGENVYGGGVAAPVIDGGVLFAVDPMLRAVDLRTGQERWQRPGETRSLAADHDAVYVERATEVLVALDAATGAPRAEVSLGSDFEVRVEAGGGAAGPLVVVEASEGGTWLLGRAEAPAVPVAYTVRGRLVADGVPKRAVAGVSVRVGERRVRTDAQGRFEASGRAVGAVSVGLGNDVPPWEPGGSRVRFERVIVDLDRGGVHSVGDLPLYEWSAA